MNKPNVSFTINKFGTEKIRTLCMLGDQAANSLWNFGLGTIVAKWGGIDLFGNYIVAMSIYFVAGAAVAAMTVGVISVDSSRVSFSKKLYMNSARSIVDIISILIGALLGFIYYLTYKPSNHVIDISIFGAFYILFGIYSDVSRRVISLNEGYLFVFVVSFIRLMLFAIVAFHFIFINNNSVYNVLIISLIITIFYSIVLALWGDRHFSLRSRISIIAFSRQLRLGAWLFGSAIVSSGFEYGAAYYSGLKAGPAAVGGWRAGSYLFSFLGPLLQVMELVLPRFVIRRFGYTPNLKVRIFYLVSSLLIGLILSAPLAAANAFIWLPWLGQQYESYWTVSMWYWWVFVFIIARTSLMPFLKTRRSQPIFFVSVLASLIGLTSLTFAGVISAQTISVAVFMSSAINLTGAAFLFFGIERKE